MAITKTNANTRLKKNLNNIFGNENDGWVPCVFPLIKSDYFEMVIFKGFKRTNQVWNSSCKCIRLNYYCTIISVFATNSLCHANQSDKANFKKYYSLAIIGMN